MLYIPINVGKTIINHPFGNRLYHLFVVIWGIVYYCFTHIISHIIFSIPGAAARSLALGIFLDAGTSHFNHDFSNVGLPK